ncbi:MAG: hypothetical protein UX49_C0021G0025 [Candidatus Wolfebacteria bacterium GW2011_GWC2_46_275]|uniref:Uncharacterized protein n=2 Tax=Candidatus Wolfeibacteriota TaxID=1752735 RepID=A0A0G1WJM7_9BACT|nr:MAG: hypothetical protein UX70_C0001G0794 [Candidatus Wolfebacteria bacterium GW2011_GWB1_47_1]KKU36201.1 MAG: hypothetical protein UX49_C0021G0025 [Candidatus Wolfebacteria bacterium GW2011_GWC2_46_275]KKU42082.1 MAG: hypothetical protein UX58_C0003G0006 [Candidatus Wolfebacteria bacterium GW2011_GWB2_46_69]KKU53713.1 MAG: hypothetical protein UX76_C0011G0058 [Candidatus Wolfebacteria bacterium GW2011_GWC1_47_103]KKU59329.1 MAG: hypothetical protein UX83_C0006G0099 [Candidatus Wolfebacteria
MDYSKIKLYLWEGLHWDIDYDINGNPCSQIALCPKQKCNCKLKKSKEVYSIGEYKYCCSRCDFKITLNKPIEEKVSDLLDIIESQKYKDAEIINIDGELIRIQREELKDNDYWVDVKLSRNKKKEVQLMVLAGHKKDKTKTQLFVDPKNERLAFDQGDDHPGEVFAKVVAFFKNTVSELKINEDDNISEL